MSDPPLDEYLPDQSFREAATLYRVATSAYQRTRSSGEDRDPGQVDALIAIVFAAASLEAFINQVSDLAERMSRENSLVDDPSLRRYALLAGEIEQANGSTELKYRVLSIELAGRQLNTGSGPFQDQLVLFRLRNQLVHLRTVAGPGSSDSGTPNAAASAPEPRILSQLRSRNVTADEMPQAGQLPWIDRICTRAVARWACKTASDVVQQVVSSAPPGAFSEALQIAGTRFKLVD